MLQYQVAPNTIFSIHPPETSQILLEISLSLVKSAGKSQFLPNLISALSLAFTLQIIPSTPVLLPDQVLVQKPLSLNVPSCTTAFILFVISQKTKLPTHSIVRSPITVPLSLKSGALKRITVPSINSSLHGPRKPDVRLLVPILPMNSQYPDILQMLSGPSSKQ